MNTISLARETDRKRFEFASDLGAKESDEVREL